MPKTLNPGGPVLRARPLRAYDLSAEEVEEIKQRYLAAQSAPNRLALIEPVQPVSDWDRPEKPCGKVTAIALSVAVIWSAAMVALGAWIF